ncbi:MAG: OmpA family protein [Desulfobacteraceae bacterium]|jgi:uncharacterized repeat protein (TIGR01451 family)
MGANRAWGPVCALILSLFVLVGPALAVPPGTVIDNTAEVAYRSWGIDISASSTVSLTTEWRRTPAQIELLQYAPTVGGAPMVSVAMTAYDEDGIAGGSSQQITALYPAGNTTPIDLAQPVPLIAASIYHQGEPIFFRVTDEDQNMDPAAADTIWMQASASGSSGPIDNELLLLTETGPDTGVFVGYLQSSGLGPAQAYNGVLDVTADTQIQATYTDIADASDSVAMAALVDPYGLVFDSTTGQPVDDVQLTLVDDASGNPATVYGDDGVSIFPATITSGATVVDSGGQVYAFDSGQYRFPFVAPGTYRLVATPAPGYAAPSTALTADLQALPGAPFAIAEPGSRGEVFVINPGPAIRIDVPVDPTAVGLWLQKSANRDIVAVGDFVQYTVSVQNNSGAPAASVEVHDLLPMGFRYRSGSARLDSVELADPQVAANGRDLTFAIGDLADGATAEIRYVTEVAAGAQLGEASNRATAASGALSSNVANVTITVKEDLFRSRNFIAGRVIADNCDDLADRANDGVEGARIYLEDGTYVITDAQGRYHFEGVTSGTHVVQLDLESLPDIYEIAACEDNSRSAGTAFSRFVELHGGTLWRADFHVQTKTPPMGRTQLKLSCGLSQKTVNYHARIDVQDVAVDNLRLTVLLPDNTVYEKGSSRLGNQAIADPLNLGGALTYRLGDFPAGRQAVLHFKVYLNGAAKPGRLHTKAMLTFDTPGRKNQRTKTVDTVLALSERVVRTVQPPKIVRPQFDVLSVALTDQDRRMLDALAAELASLEIDHVVFTGYTDNRKIRASARYRFPNNEALSLIRAETVARYLAPKLGLTDARMTIIGKGAKAPLADNATEKGRALNRRVEVKVMSVSVNIFHDLASIKCEDQAVVDTRGSHQTIEKVPTPEENGEDASFDSDPIDIESLSPGFALLWPTASARPSIPSINLAIEHAPADRIELLLNGQPVCSLNFDGQKKNKAGTVAVSFWRGVDIVEGDNHLTAVRKDQNGKTLERLERTVHYAGPPVTFELLKEQSRLIANGKDVPEIAIRLLDKDGHPARFGIHGEYTIQPPYQAYAPEGSTDALTRVSSEKPRYTVGRDGIAHLALAPTTQSGRAVATVVLAGREYEVAVWLQPELREWILVGLAEGTTGYNTVSGNMENLGAADQDEAYYTDGRIAFFAKGKVKGQWLLTMAYDSERQRDDRDNQLFQTIDPDTYYTLYGDAASQAYEAPSIRKLYLKIERQQFYALFGDYDTGMTVTELSRYSRRFNGLKSEYHGERFGLNLFASDTDQAFVKDEIRGDGTSGLYRLSRKQILINSETVAIETRDRFHSEVVLATQSMSRHIDYNIDYDAGTLFFKAPVYSRDENFNPIYIVVDYESRDGADAAYTYGGRGAVKLAGGRVEIGASLVHEGPSNAEADLGGLDARVDLGHGVQIKAEVATTRKDETGDETTGRGLLAQVSKQGADLNARVYFREQEEDFGVGQQNGSESGTRKVGADADWRISQHWSMTGELFRNTTLATDAERDVGESRLIFTTPQYKLNAGFRLAEDRYDNNDSVRSTQLLAGASRQFLDNRLALRLDHEQSLGDDNRNSDYPTKTVVGADYKITDPVTIFAEHEVTQGQDLDTQSSRAGLKATPWTGGRVGSSVGQQVSENGDRLYANLGLSQKWRINDRWSVDGGLDRTQTVGRSDSAPLNTNVPSSVGSEEDFTAVSLGAAYRADAWSWTARVESRYADSQDKLGVISAVSGEIQPGLGLAVGLKLFDTRTETGIETFDGDVRLSLAYRPGHSSWIVYDRLEYIFEDQQNAGGSSEARRIVNNLNLNCKPHHRLQLAFQYGAKYVFDTIDDASYSGYTDLIGLEARYDLTRQWDLGLHSSVLHSWSAGQLDYRSGVSVGYALIKNMWISAGYNFTGFEDQDFSAADFTAAGPFVKFRFKFDQQSVREIVDLLKTGP